MNRQPRTLSRRRSPAGHALLAVIIALGLGSLLNARALERTAGNLPYGTARSVAVAVAGPLRSISSFLLLDRPRLGLDRPERAIGTNTVAAMQSGLVFGYVGLIEGFGAFS